MTQSIAIDQHVQTTQERPWRPTDFEPETQTELCSWYRNADLHAWMERLYREKGGMWETFVFASVEIDADDMDRLEALMALRMVLREPSDASFIHHAREALRAGATVFYWASR